MDTSTSGMRGRERAGERVGREVPADFDFAELRGLQVKASSGEAGEPDWLYIATADPAFFLKGVE